MQQRTQIAHSLLLDFFFFLACFGDSCFACRLEKSEVTKYYYFMTLDTSIQTYLLLKIYGNMLRDRLEDYV